MDTVLLTFMSSAVFGILIKYSIIQASVPLSTKLLRSALILTVGYVTLCFPLTIYFGLSAANSVVWNWNEFVAPLLLLLVLLNVLLFVIGIRSQRNWTIVGAIGMTIASNWSILTLLLTAPTLAFDGIVGSLVGVVICFGLLVWPLVQRLGKSRESIARPVAVTPPPKPVPKRDPIKEPDFLNALFPQGKLRK